MFSDRDYNRRMRPRSNNHAVPTIILINIVVFILQQITNGNGNSGIGSITFNFSLIPYMVTSHFQVWRLFTYMFLHGGIWHIALNMWGLYLFGSMLERYIGTKKFVFLYLVSGVFGGFFWLLFNWTGFDISIGASGAVFGVIVATAMLFPNTMIMLLIPPIPLKLKTFAIIYIIIELLSSISGYESGIAHLCHLGGVISGYVIIRFMFPRETYDIFKFLKKKMPVRIEKNRSNSASKNWTIVTNANKLDAILDKISKHGINSLTDEERNTLKQAREKRNN